jgi:hypothetical protein
LPNLTMTSTLKILAKSSSNRRNHKNAYWFYRSIV